MRILDALEQVASSRQVQSATIAMAWLKQQPGITAPIASATSTAQLQDLVAAARLDLTREEVEYLKVNSQ